MSRDASCLGPAWPRERVLFALAGPVHVVAGACPAWLVLTRPFRLRSALYPKEVVQ